MPKGQLQGRLAARVAVIAACCTIPAAPAFSGEAPSVPSTEAQTETGAPPPPASTAQPHAPSGGAGMIVYIDPQTGRVLSAPAPGTVPLPLSPQERNALSTSHDGLVEVPSPVPGGGVLLDLQGRFQSPLIATIDANGKVRTQHLDPPAGDKH